MSARIRELFFRGLYCATVKHLPRSRRFTPAKYLRTFFAKLIGCKVGRNANLESGADFDSRLVIGENSSLGVRAEAQGPIFIGNNVMMGPECIILTRNHRHDRIDMTMIDQGFEQYRPVTIGDDVWIGCRVTILPGVTIGSHSIIAAGAVVTKDVEDFSIVGGVPARKISSRI